GGRIDDPGEVWQPAAKPLHEAPAGIRRRGVAASNARPQSLERRASDGALVAEHHSGDGGRRDDEGGENTHGPLIVVGISRLASLWRSAPEGVRHLKSV